MSIAQFPSKPRRKINKIREEEFDRLLRIASLNQALHRKTALSSMPTPAVISKTAS